MHPQEGVIMKAYYLSIQDDPDQGTFVVFADTRNQARSQADGHDLFYDSWLDIHAVRAKKYDDLENLSEAELHLKLWHDGWRWYDIDDMPDVDEATDQDFLDWHKRTFNRSES